MSRCPVIAILALSLAVGVAAAAEHKVIAPPGTDLGLPFSPGILSTRPRPILRTARRTGLRLEKSRFNTSVVTPICQVSNRRQLW